MLKEMIILGERITKEEEEESEETDEASDTASIGDTESFDIALPAPGNAHKALDMPPLPPPLPSHARTRSRSVPPSPTCNRYHGKAKKPKDREPFYKDYGVV